jgi:leucyl/phenylalanyl-tRNA--protein transferase
MRSRVNNFPYLSEHEHFYFPHPEKATPEGILAVGGNLSPGMLISAYSQGIFPWFSDNEPILWWSPDPRFVIFPRDVRVSKFMKKVIRKGIFGFSLDSRFRDVVTACSRTLRPGQNGTWITEDMIEGYARLHELGYAHSVEVYTDNDLAGGLYGVSLGGVFFGESMFAWKPNASKAAFLLFSLALGSLGFDLIDSQVKTAHIESLGGRCVSRDDYLSILKKSLEKETVKGNWKSVFPDFPRSECARDRGLFSI